MPVCSKCQQEKSEDCFHVSKGKRRKDCKVCHNAACMKVYFLDHPARLEYARAHAKKNRARETATARIRRQTRRATYLIEHAAEIQQKKLDRKAKSKAKHDAGVRRWYQANTEHRKNYLTKWKASNRATVDAYNVARDRAKAKLDPAEKAEVIAIYALSKSDAVIPCHICGNPTHKGSRHVDHKTPLSRGGKHSASNLGIAHSSCNLSKYTRTAEELPVVHNASLPRINCPQPGASQAPEPRAA